MACELTQIIYDESQRAACYGFASIHFNETLTPYFENSVIIRVVESSKADKIAVCSWRLKEKFKWYIGKRREFTQEVLDSDYDVLALTRNTKNHRMIEEANVYHKGFRETFRKILMAIDVPAPHEVKIPIYQNHFSAKREIYQDYIKRYLKPAIEVMENDPEIRKLAMADSNYSVLDKASPEKLDRLEKLIGMRFYPLSPFLLERLFSVYVQNERIKVTHL